MNEENKLTAKNQDFISTVLFDPEYQKLKTPEEQDAFFRNAQQKALKTQKLKD